jgi:hypothetical protein
MVVPGTSTCRPTLSSYDYRARTLWPDVGRFGQEDPGKAQPAVSLSESLLGDWQGYTDPSGRYETDFHFYGVYYLARAAALYTDTSYHIAWASQYFDNKSGFMVVGGTAPNFQNVLNSEMLESFHFTARSTVHGVVRNNPDVRFAVHKAIETRDPIRFGISLHTFADSFAHEERLLHHSEPGPFAA